MSPADAGSAARGGEGTDTAGGETTSPEAFRGTPSGNGARSNDQRVGLSKADGSGDSPGDRRAPYRNGWASGDRQETVQMDAVGANAYSGAGAYGSLGPPASAYGGSPSTAQHGGGGYGSSPAGPSAAAAANAAARAGAARRARLKVAHLGPLSVFRVSLTFALCMFVVLLVAVAALWAVLDTSGVFKSIEDAANTLVDKNRSSVADWLSFGRVMIITVVVGAANAIAFTLLSTIGALLYNLCSDFVGGVEVTLVER